MKRFSHERVQPGFTAGDETKLLGDDTPFAIREAYNSTRTKLLFYGQGEKCPVFAVTSSLPGDGKTMSSVNLAISFAQMGKKTLLIDGDMRKATMHSYLKIGYQDGLSELMAGLTKEINIREAGKENLFFLPSGDIPPNPAELLASSKMTEVIKALREKFDYIIIDTPPVEVVTDAALLAPYVTGYVFIVKCGSSDINIVKHSIETIQELKGNIVGFILNDSNNVRDNYYRSSGYYKKYYKYGGYKYGRGASYAYGYVGKKDLE